MKKWFFLLFAFIVFIGGVFAIFSYTNSFGYSRHIIVLIDNNQMDDLSVYLKKNGNIDSKPYVFDIDRTNFPPLTYAAKVGNFEAVKLLLDHGADVNNTEGTNGTSPLLASLSLSYTFNPDRIEIAQYLIDHGAEINYRDRNGYGNNAISATLMPLSSPPNEEQEECQYDFIQYLVDEGAEYQINCTYGNLLSKSAAYNNVSVVDYLINELGMSIDIVDSSGCSPLMYAVENGSLDAVRYLINQGAEKNLINEDGKTALDIAQEKGNVLIIALFDESN